VPNSPARWRVTLAFATVYLVWGSTYLAIRFAVEAIPPFLMAGTRFIVAGGILYGWARLRGAAAPTRAHWRSAVISGGLMLACGNGTVVWAETRVPSGLTALLVALVPAWTVVAEWILPGGRAPRLPTVAGLLAGLAGMALLGAEGAAAGGAGPGAAALLALAAFTWALGSIYQHRGAPRPESAPLATSLQMLAGGAILLVVFALVPGTGSLPAGALAGRPLLALGYLILFGSIVTYSAFVWLLQVSTPARVSTYAYVNPVVALVLGWGVAGERLGPAALAASALIIASVAVITWDQSRPAT
jgi:drug/metabolite transporter (DMT)-like permease